MRDWKDYWSGFDRHLLASGADFPLASSPVQRNKFYVRWSGLPHHFQLAACGPRLRKGTEAPALSVELIRDGEGPTEVEQALLTVLPLVRLAWGNELDYRPGGKQFKIDASVNAFGEMESDLAQYRWLLSGVIRLHLMLRPVLAAVSA